ncbi:dnaJ homolog subfamily B member 13-like [Neltuma alba]|uniref:dnaJ homolog subfamily B member 13-like n=1 Tax=Neltuma alba TaxID=207710 RepID=UPI0010A519BB|nr:dnaJ homolog subfamily B member 13-like [Prosopis alba]
MTVPSHEVDDHHKGKGVEENRFFKKTASKRSKTPTPSINQLSRDPSRRCTTPTPFSRNLSIRTNSDSDIEASTLSRIMSRRRASATTSTSPLASPSGQMSSKCISEPQTPKLSASPLKEGGSASLSRSTSGRSTTSIIYSQSIVRRKPPPVEMKLECTLEDLCFGSVKKIKITKDVIRHPGIIVQEEEILKIEVKPGWRKGTKITFEGKGDEKPGYLPADVVFLIDEKDHPFFTRDGDNLEVTIDIPLVSALTGCSIQVPLIGGETMTMSFEDTVIYPGYQKVIEGKGMPNPKQEDGKRGDLHIKFIINFPRELSDEQKEEAVTYLKDCS